MGPTSHFEGGGRGGGGPRGSPGAGEIQGSLGAARRGLAVCVADRLLWPSSERRCSQDRRWPETGRSHLPTTFLRMWSDSQRQRQSRVVLPSRFRKDR